MHSLCMDNKCNHAREVVAAARAGLAYIRCLKPTYRLAAFHVVGLVTLVRGVWHALDADKKLSDAHRRSINDWRKSVPTALDRFHHLLRPARDEFIKEYSVWPVSYGDGEDEYGLAMHISANDERLAVLTSQEISERELASMFAERVSGSSEHIQKNIRVDVLPECEKALDVWDLEIEKIEAAITKASEVE